MDGTVLRINATIPSVPDIEKLETVALSPLTCTDGIDSLTWQSHGGQVRSRPARRTVETWNGQSADGWIGMRCGDGTETFVAHRTLQRSLDGLCPHPKHGCGFIYGPSAPFGGMGPGILHGKLEGMELAKSRPPPLGLNRPAAPDWSGQSVSYTLLLTDGSDTDVQICLPIHRLFGWVKSHNHRNDNRLIGFTLTAAATSSSQLSHRHANGRQSRAHHQCAVEDTHPPFQCSNPLRQSIRVWGSFQAQPHQWSESAQRQNESNKRS